MNISVVVLSRNEEGSIVRCLTSVKWADEILLLDDSTDDTLKNAQSLQLGQKLRIIKTTQQQDFAKLRNEALKQVNNEWVLFLDADEEVPSELAAEIKTALSQPSVDGFYLKRRDFFEGRWLLFGETGAIGHIKLGRKTGGKWVRRVHEQWALAGAVSSLKTPLNHYPHPTVAEFLAHVSRWTSLDAQEFFEAGQRVNFFTIVAYPTGKFFINYFVKQGFRDRMPGLIMATMMSFHSFLTRAKIYMLTQKISSA